ncbi:relaxase domain-containing protein [Amycolatopsis sp. RM579]|uniref:Relaxase domain-containing protein n=1 Tax=Amycolatopsis pithecellobii TaxID=664692 RepID=A0A6N7YX44_9PSEU|nr:relaxase domain-containing protein [Amycolatopsis pithecellobii]
MLWYVVVWRSVVVAPGQRGRQVVLDDAQRADQDAAWAGNRAVLDYLSEHAGYSRVGHHGGAAGRFIDAHDLVVASFFQHDSRNHDPQLHMHNAILNRVEGSDGLWRTLHGRALYLHRGAAAAVGERTTQEHLVRALGVRFASHPDGKAREVVGISPQVMKAVHPQGAERSPARPRRWSRRSRRSAAASRIRWSWTGCNGRPPSPPARPGPTTVKPPRPGSSAGTGSCVRRSPTDSPAWPATFRPSRTSSPKRPNGHGR